MKILIISLPRTGSSFFCNYLANKNNLECIHEPFNEVNNLEKYKNYNWNLNKNICVKTHINHKDINFYIEYVKNFDTIYLLSRKNLKDCAESFAYATYYNNFRDKYRWIPTPNLYKCIDLINEYNNKLIELSKLLNLDIIYYEDIFNISSDEKFRFNINNNLI